MTGSALVPVRAAGRLVAFGLDTARLTFARPFQWRELAQQVWFIARDAVSRCVVITFGVPILVGFLITACYVQAAPCERSMANRRVRRGVTSTLGGAAAGGG